MPNETITPFEKLAQMHKCIDAPKPDQTVYDECISIAGWIFVEGRGAAACRVRAWLDGAAIGKPGFCLRVRVSPTFVSAARCSYCIPFSSARGWVQRRFDEGLMESLADIALCLKMRRAGHLIVTLLLQNFAGTNNTMIRSTRLARRLCGNGGLAFCSGTLIMIQVFLAKTPISR